MRINERMRKTLSILLCLCMVLQYAPMTAFAVTTDNLCEHHTEHTAECHYAEGSPGSACTHEHSEDCYKIVECLHTCGDECANGCGHSCTVENGCITMEADCHHTHGDCGYAPATEGTPCTHVCEVKVNSADSCYKLLCSHKDGGHDEACGYVAAVEAHECHYECAECAAALTSEEETDPTTQPTTEPTTAPTTESAPVCTCESDDPEWHAPFCDLYVVPENPRCYCVEKCGDGAFNEWCEVCYFDPDACWASGEEEAVVYPSTPTYIASIGIAQDASSGSTGVNDCKNELSGHTIIDRDLNDGAGGDYVYIGYKTTTDPSKAITGILFRVGENPPDRITDNGKAYFYLVGGSYESNTASEGGYIDLNATAGGDYIYMYVTRDSSYGAPLTTMTVDKNSSKSGYTTGTNTSGSVIDLNQNAGGDYLYLHYKRFSETVNATYYYLDAGGSRTSSTQSATVKNHLETLTKVPSYPTSVTYDGRTFTFKGWREDNTADAATVTAPSVTYITGDKTYRAVYSANVNLSYDANGGSGAPAAQTAIQYINAGYASTVAKQSVRFTIPDSTYTHDSKCFLGWSANQAATTVTYQPGGTISIDSNKTLYAVYADHSYNNGICSNCGAYIPDAVAVLSKNGKNVFAGTTLDAVITEAEKCVESDKAVVTILQDIDLGSNYQQIDSGVFTIDLNGCKLSNDNVHYSTLRIYNSGTDITLISSRTGGTVENRRYNGSAIFTASNTNLTATGISVIAGSEGTGFKLNGNASLSDVTVQAVKEGIRVQTISTQNKTSLTCTNCTVQATDTALYVDSDCTATITGGSFTGGEDDIRAFGSVTVAGTTFPGGINVYGTKRLNNILADGTAYWAGDTMLSIGDDVQSITDKGDITVKAACTHESGKQNYVNNGDDHTYTWSCCKLEVTEAHTFTDTKCVCGARDHDCVYTNGFCEKGCYEPAELVDGYYQIKSGGNLFWFAEYINTVDRTASAKLTADIDLENRAWTPIGSTGEGNNNFRGHFDGQGYSITGLNVNANRAGAGFFGEVRLGTVENFTIRGTVTVTAINITYVGGVIGSAPGANSDQPDHNGATIRNITSYVNVTVQDGLTGVGRIGGFMGYANHETIIEKCAWYGTLDLGNQAMTLGAGGFIGRINEDSAVTIRNCGAYGSIVNEAVTENVGAFMGLTNSRSNTVIENCLFAGGVTGANASAVTPFGTWNGASKTLTNSYYINTLGTTDADATAVTPDQLASGEVAWLLNGSQSEGVWKQNVGIDPYPSFTGDPVTKGDSEDMPYYNDGVVRVNISWTEMSFTYTVGQWDPETHTSSGGGWTADKENGGQITVTNSGGTNVPVSFTFQGTMGDVSGIFTVEKAALAMGQSVTTTLSVTGDPKQSGFQDAQIGTVTVSLGSSGWAVGDKITMYAKDGNHYVATIGEVTDSKLVLIEDTLRSATWTNNIWADDLVRNLLTSVGARFPSTSEAVAEYYRERTDGEVSDNNTVGVSYREVAAYENDGTLWYRFKDYRATNMSLYQRSLFNTSRFTTTEVYYCYIWDITFAN